MSSTGLTTESTDAPQTPSRKRDARFITPSPHGWRSTQVMLQSPLVGDSPGVVLTRNDLEDFSPEQLRARIEAWTNALIESLGSPVDALITLHDLVENSNAIKLAKEREFDNVRTQAIEAEIMTESPLSYATPISGIADSSFSLSTASSKSSTSVANALIREEQRWQSMSLQAMEMSQVNQSPGGALLRTQQTELQQALAELRHVKDALTICHNVVREQEIEIAELRQKDAELRGER